MNILKKIPVASIIISTTLTVLICLLTISCVKELPINNNNIRWNENYDTAQIVALISSTLIKNSSNTVTLSDNSKFSSYWLNDEQFVWKMEKAH